MANNQLTVVEDLTPKQDFVNMKVRIIRHWVAGYHLHMILLDEKGGKIQAFVKKELLPQFDKLINEDEVVLIKKFGVGSQNDMWPVLDLKIRMNFYRCTQVFHEQCFNGHPYGFAFVPYNEITKQKSTEVKTVDVIGYVTWCGNLDIFRSATTGKESKRFNVDMKDLEGNVLRCTLWGDYAVQFNTFVKNNTSDEHVITIIQHGLIKIWGEQITVQSDRYGTRVFINEDIKEANDLRRRLILQEGGTGSSQTVLSSQTCYPTRHEFLVETQRKHVDEIRECPENTQCIVLGKIELLEHEFGWFYVSCRKCNKKVLTKPEFLAKVAEPTEELINAPSDSLWCEREGIQATSIEPKYRVTFRVQDSTGTVSFLMFDSNIARLLGVSAYDVHQRQLSAGNPHEWPHELDVLLNKTLAFKIVVSKYNAQFHYKVFTVLKVCDDPSVLDELQTQDQPPESSHDPHLDDILSAKISDSSQACAFDSKDVVSVTGDSSTIDLDKDSETSPLPRKHIPLAAAETPGQHSATHVSKRVRKVLHK